MSFYICPPSTGTTELATIVNDVKIRLKLLHIISQCDGTPSTLGEQLCALPFASESDSFIEFTPRDSNAHFLLRVVATGSSALEQLLLRAEPLLLLHRLHCGRSLHTPVLQLQRDLQQAQDTLCASRDLRAAMMQASDVVDGVLAMKCAVEEQRCSGCSVTVPWTVVPQLVARRGVVLTRGQCRVPCHLAPQLLAELFTLLLRSGLRDLANHRQLNMIAQETPHLHAALTRSVRQFLRSHQLQPSLWSGCTSSLPPLTAKEVPSAALLFPPCILQLQRLLHRHRRLQHHQRYRYTVFLKGVGMSLDQNITYWQEHYSCSAHHHATCEHSWPRHGARYLYSLRHAYGLEGRRLSARPHSCQQLQSLTPQPGDCGGCPFAAVAEGTPRDDTLGGDYEGGHYSASMFSEIETNLLGTENTRDASGRLDAHGSKGNRDRMAEQGEPSFSKNLFNDLKDNNQKRPRLGDNRARKLMRCNSFSMEVFNSETMPSSQTVLMDISNSLPNQDFFRTRSTSSAAKKYSLCRPTASSHKRRYTLLGLKAERNCEVRLLPSRSPGKSPTANYASPTQSESTLPGKSSNNTLPASSRTPWADLGPSSIAGVSSVTQRSPTTSSGPTTHLRNLLKVYGLPSSSTEEIVRAALRGHPALACRMTLASLLEAAQGSRGGRAGMAGAEVGVTSTTDTGISGSESKAGTAGMNGVDSRGQNKGEAGKSLDKVEVVEGSFCENSMDISSKRTSNDCITSLAAPTVKTTAKCSLGTEVVVMQDSSSETSTNSIIELKRNSPTTRIISPARNSSINPSTIQSVVVSKAEYCCALPTLERHIETLHTSLNREKSVSVSGIKEIKGSNAPNTKADTEQIALKRKAVQFENLSDKDKIRKLLVKTKSLYQPVEVRACKKGVNVFDGKMVTDSTQKRHPIKGSVECLETVKRKETIKKIENLRSVGMEEFCISSEIPEDERSTRVSAFDTGDDCQIVYDSHRHAQSAQPPVNVPTNRQSQVGVKLDNIPNVMCDYTSEQVIRIETPHVKYDKTSKNIATEITDRAVVNTEQSKGNEINQANQDRNLVELHKKIKLATTPQQCQNLKNANPCSRQVKTMPSTSGPINLFNHHRTITAASSSPAQVTDSIKCPSKTSISVSRQVDETCKFVEIHAANNQNTSELISKNCLITSIPNINPRILGITVASSASNIDTMQSAILECNILNYFEPPSSRATAVISPAITTTINVSSLREELRTESCDTAVVISSFSKAIDPKQCAAVAAITTGNGPIMKACGTPNTTTAKISRTKMSRDTLPEPSRSWYQRAVDPCDTSLSFVSPVQFYAIVKGLSGQ